ncbi:hypothetical protein SB861_14655 [Paraburkholderia sp. SIMBA_049]
MSIVHFPVKTKDHPDDTGTDPASLYVAKRIVRVLFEEGYPVSRDDDMPCASDDLEESLRRLCHDAGRTIAEHPGSRIAEIDAFECEDVAGRVFLVIELSTGHMFGGSVPILGALKPGARPALSNYLRSMIAADAAHP